MFAIHALIPLKNLNKETYVYPDKHNGWEMGTWGIGEYLDLFEEAGLKSKKINPYYTKKAIKVDTDAPVFVSYKFSKAECKKILKVIEEKGNVKCNIKPEYFEEFKNLFKNDDLVFYGS